MEQQAGHGGTRSHLCPAARVGQRWREELPVLQLPLSLESHHALGESRVGIPLSWIAGKLEVGSWWLEVGGCWKLVVGSWTPAPNPPHIPHVPSACRHKVISQSLDSSSLFQPLTILGFSMRATTGTWALGSDRPKGRLNNTHTGDTARGEAQAGPAG